MFSGDLQEVSIIQKSRSSNLVPRLSTKQSVLGTPRYILCCAIVELLYGQLSDYRPKRLQEANPYKMLAPRSRTHVNNSESLKLIDLLASQEGFCSVELVFAGRSSHAV